MKTTVLTALAVFTLCGTNGHAQNLLLNGSFESPVITTDGRQIGVPTSWQAIGSPRIMNGNFDVPDLQGPENGHQYISIGNDGTQASIFQAFTVSASGIYQLTWYDNAGSLPGQQSPYSMDVVGGSGTVAQQSIVLDGGTPGWTSRSMQLNLAPGTYTITFSSHQSGVGGLSTLLDNVSIVGQAQAVTIDLNDGGVTTLELVARDTSVSFANTIEDLFPTSLPYDASSDAVVGAAQSHAQFHLAQDGFSIESSGTRPGLIDSRANVQPVTFFSVSADTSYSLAGALSVDDPGSSGKFASLETKLTDVDTLAVLFYNDQESFGVVDQSFTLGGTAGNVANALSGSTTGLLLAGHRYRLFYGTSIYAANTGDPASFTGSFALSLGTTTDTTPPTITCSADIDVPCSSDLLVPVTFSVSAADDTDPSPTIICTPPSGSDFAVGTMVVSCTATDASANASQCSFTITRLPLAFSGFLSPIGGPDASGGSFMSPVRTFKLGSTIPVKFTASCGGSALVTGTHKLQVIKYTDATTIGDPIDATPQDAATIGNEFRFANGNWQFNLDTRRTGMSTGIWQFVATLSDGSQHSVWLQLK